MLKRKTEYILPTPEEEAIINAQIAEDPDTFEADDEWFKNAKPTRELFPEIVQWYQQRQADLKAGIIQDVHLTLDADIVRWFQIQAYPDGKTGGTGWHPLVNQALREYIAGKQGEANPQPSAPYQPAEQTAVKQDL